MSIQQIKSGVIADNAVTAAKIDDSTSQLFGFRNKIINGAMEIWQRGTSFSGSTQYTADRYVVNSSTGTVTRDTDVPSGQGFTYSMKQVSSNQAFCFLQPVELLGAGLPGEFRIGSTWTFSFWMKGSGSGSISLGPEFRDVGISGTNSAAAASSTTINYTSTWTKFSYTFTITAAPNGTNLSLSCILFQGSQTGSLWATGFQLEAGSVDTPFERRPFGMELALCQRYFSGNFGAAFFNNSSASHLLTIYLPQPMRANPTVTRTGSYWSGSENAPSISVNYRTSFEISGGTTVYLGGQFIASAEL
jgi:hypothetical protein